MIGQITVDDVVPVNPGPWRKQLGGNALYAAAGARLWCKPRRIGVVARLGKGVPPDIFALIEAAGLCRQGLRQVADRALWEWILYEEDGNRQSVPRNPALRDPALSVDQRRRQYLLHHERLSATAGEIPARWLDAKAVHLAPQSLRRHRDSVRSLAARIPFISLDPSSHYSNSASGTELADAVGQAQAFLPSRAEIEHLGKERSWLEVAAALVRAGFQEVAIKLGDEGAVLSEGRTGRTRHFPALSARVIDLTGAGDAFCGAYTACRALDHPPQAALLRALVAAAMVVECSGVESALLLSPAAAQVRLRQFERHLA